jgi:hypothetical protein
VLPGLRVLKWSPVCIPYPRGGQMPEFMIRSAAATLMRGDITVTDKV